MIAEALSRRERRGSRPLYVRDALSIIIIFRKKVLKHENKGEPRKILDYHEVRNYCMVKE